VSAVPGSLCASAARVGVLHAVQFRLTNRTENSCDLSMGQQHVKNHSAKIDGCGTFSEVRQDWSNGKPDFENPRVGVNSRALMIYSYRGGGGRRAGDGDRR